jgi:DNA-binding NtrC family response regulator
MLALVEYSKTDRLQAGTFVRLDPSSGALRTRRFAVTVTAGPDQGTACMLEGTLIVGSSPDAGLRLNDTAVSRYHLELTLDAEGVRIRDLGSTNGTFCSTGEVKDLTLTAPDVDIFLGRSVLHLRALPQDDLAPKEYASNRFGQAVGQGAVMRKLFGALDRLKELDVTVLLRGETGTGKEVLARSLHSQSARREAPFVALHCGALSPELVESELFGHTRGAFTGALKARDGAFVTAHGGTLFLDEISSLPLELQPKLLRVLEDKRLTPLGSSQSTEVDVRVIASTHADLLNEVEAGTFRKDLYYRLAVVELQVPPLRERTEDIPLLIRQLLQELKGPSSSLTLEAFTAFVEYAWPGNVRELRNALERWCAGTPVHELLTASGSPATTKTFAPFKDAKAELLDNFTRQYLTDLMAECNDNVSEAARVAGVARAYLHELLAKYLNR